MRTKVSKNKIQPIWIFFSWKVIFIQHMKYFHKKYLTLFSGGNYIIDTRICNVWICVKYFYIFNYFKYVQIFILNLNISAYLQWLWTPDLRTSWGDQEAWSQRSLTSTTILPNVPAISPLCGVSKMITTEKNILFHVKILDKLKICLNIVR